MTAQSVALAATALRLIAKFGQPCSFRRASVPDPAKPWEPADVDASAAVSVSCSAVPASLLSFQGGGDSDSQTRRTWYVAASGLSEAPSNAHTFLESDDAAAEGVAVREVETIRISGDPVLYVLQVAA